MIDYCNNSLIKLKYKSKVPSDTSCPYQPAKPTATKVRYCSYYCLLLFGIVMPRIWENLMITFDQERPHDYAEIEQLLTSVFGANRFQKASYALRNESSNFGQYACVARAEGLVLATVRFTKIHVEDLLFGGNCNALLLGPLAVTPSMQGAGLGASLVEYALAGVEAAGHKRILLVGDKKYYGRFGFEPTMPRYITLPGGRDADRLLVRQPSDIQQLPMFGRVQPLWANFDDHYMLPEDAVGTAA